jgi:hypothetical protein
MAHKVKEQLSLNKLLKILYNLYSQNMDVELFKKLLNLLK